jgi:glycosyltransferase involved in cell wall biosynthesis
MISIITPVYNGEKFIEACIKVVIDQNCPEAEHIIVDGGSSDKTIEIIKRYAERNEHIRWISEKDQGQSDAMNKGILMAKGDIVGFLNVDDYYEPNVLNRIYELFKKSPNPSLLVGNCNVWDGTGNLMFVNQPTKLSVVDFLLGSSIPCNPSAYFYHASLHRKVGLYKVDEHYAMDLDFLLKTVQVALAIHFDEIWGNFRLIEGTKTLADIRNGQMQDRMHSIFKAHEKNISIVNKIQLWTVRGYVKFRNNYINKGRLLRMFKFQNS